MSPQTVTLFELGSVVITPALLSLFQGQQASTADFLLRHQTGDFGNICADDVEANQHAVHNHTRILSIYQLGEIKFWIITEADRSSTTLLLPDEY